MRRPRFILSLLICLLAISFARQAVAQDALAIKLSDVCDFSFKAGVLAMKIKPAASNAGNNPIVVQGPGGSGEWQVTVFRDARNSILQMRMHSARVRPGGGMEADDLVLINAQTLSLTHRVTSPGGQMHILTLSFIGRNGNREGNDFMGGTVVEQIIDIAGGRGRQTAREQATDMRALLAKKPEGKDEMVQLLQNIGVPLLQAPDPSEAFEVFSDRWPLDEKVAAEVKSLLPDLDDERFEDREAATARVRALGRPAAVVIARMDRTNLSPEQNARLDTAILALNPLTTAQAAAKRKDRDFLLGCLMGEDRDVRVQALRELDSITGEKIAFDLDASSDDRAEAAQALRDRLAEKFATTQPAEKK